MKSMLDGMVVDLGRAAHTLTKALDYVGIDDQSHGRRVGLICHRIAHYLGWKQERRHFILLAGMLHDCGVSSTAVHQKLVDELEWDGAAEHCLRGETFLKGFQPFSPFSRAIHYHHTRWNDLPDTLDQVTRENANLIFLADRLDVLYAKHTLEHPAHTVLMCRQRLMDQLGHYVGKLFSADLYEATCRAVVKDSFWLELQEEFLDDAIFETLDHFDHKLALTFDEIESLGELFSRIVDAKSPFTHYHSLRVADLAYAISDFLGYDEQTKRVLRITGLLHDVGKLRTPDEILEKPGALTDDERAQMTRHPLDSRRVLNAIFPNTPIGRWASEHHEKLNGTGYPFGWSGDMIDRETRILTIADIFQALCQERPYRERLQPQEVVSIMVGMEEKGELDSGIMDKVRHHCDHLYEIAIFEGRQQAAE